VAAGTTGGELLDAAEWPAGYRHGETLLPAIDDLLRRLEVGRAGLSAVVVGTGPGAFTGLRVGLATAKGLAHGLELPLVGISTAQALLAAAMAHPVPGDRAPVLLQPAGPADRILVRPGAVPILLPAGTEPELAPNEVLVAIDLEGRAPDDALARGVVARAGLAAALVRLGAARLAAGDADDLAGLVPEYVTLPRGVRAEVGEVAWSHDRP